MAVMEEFVKISGIMWNNLKATNEVAQFKRQVTMEDGSFKPYQKWISPGISQKILSSQHLLVIEYKNLQNNILPEHLTTVKSN